MIQDLDAGSDGWSGVIYLPFSLSGEIATTSDAPQMVDDPNWAVAEIGIDEGGNPVVEIIEDGLIYEQAQALLDGDALS